MNEATASPTMTRGWNDVALSVRMKQTAFKALHTITAISKFKLMLTVHWKLKPLAG